MPGGRGLGEWEVTPGSSWNYGLDLTDSGPEDWPLVRQGVGEVPFDARTAAVVVHGRSARIPCWSESEGSAAEPPDSPVAVSGPALGLRLVPYGNARLRITEMPTVLRVSSG